MFIALLIIAFNAKAMEITNIEKKDILTSTVAQLFENYYQSSFEQGTTIFAFLNSSNEFQGKSIIKFIGATLNTTVITLETSIICKNNQSWQVFVDKSKNQSHINAV